MSQATRTIIFDTKNHLALNAGVLLAWIAVSLFTITSLTLFQRRKQRLALSKDENDTELRDMRG